MVDSNYDGISVPETDNSNLHQQFGRETELGKQLYGMYGRKQKPQINYPPVKTKSRAEEPKETKPCPQKTEIEYPEPQRRQYRKYNPIDFVPKRKAGDEILAQMDRDKNRPLGKAPGKVPQNRPKKIEELQEKFQFKDNAELERHIAMQRAMSEKAASEYVMDDKTRRQLRFKGGISKNHGEHYEEKYGVKQSQIKKLLQKPSDMKHVRSAQDAELEDLFLSVVEEIEDRQEHMERLGEGCDKVTAQRLKNEIIERVGELQRIRELQT